MAPIKKTTKATGEKVSAKKDAPAKATKAPAKETAAAKAKVSATPKKAASAKAVEKPKAAPAAKAAPKKAPAKKTAKTATAAVKKAAPKATATTKAATTKSAPKAAPAKAASKQVATKKAPATIPSATIPSTAPSAKSAMLEVEARERELPLEYGDTKIVLLTRDPEWIFAYWEINPETRKKHGLTRGVHSKAIALRVHTLASRGHIPSYDVPVNDYTSSWYVRVPAGGSRFRVDLGTFDAKGGFVTLASSNEIEVPRMEIAESTDLEFAEINDEIYHQIVQLSGGLGIKERL
ncbi:MAG: DUF4912 domain-containing protein, partial [Alphaproteobacteria bacterium]|nr:DUF4912 domain-containing protein [Alphaproteobacteria bacterium]